MVPAKAVEVIKHFEGLHKVVRRSPEIVVVPYLCPALKWTIGYGTLCKQDHPPITEREAEDLLVRELRVYVAVALNDVPALASDDYRLSGVASWIYNLGPGNFRASTFRRRLRAGQWEAAANECERWVFAGGRKLPGLIARRSVEGTLIRLGNSSP